MKNRWILVGILAVFIVGFLVFQKVSADTAKPKLLTIKHQTLEETLSISGKIAADEDAVLRFQTSGRLNWVGVKVGDFVKKYQTIASLDQREVQANLQKYLNTYLKTRWDFDQDKENYKDTALSNSIKRILDKAQWDLTNSVIDVELKNLAVEYSNLWTPIEGLVVNVDAPQAGVNITPTQATFEIINPKTIYFSATADQSDVIKLTASQSAEIILDSFPEKTVTSKIKSISFVPKSGETGTVYEVKMSLEPNDLYRLGMTGDVNFVLRSIPNTIAVDSKLIATNPNKTKYVWVQEGDKKVKRIVTLGEIFDTQTQITSGLDDGDKVFEK